MTENVSDLVLDGNAAAGLLEEIFAPEITSAQVECEACGNIAAAAAPYHPADSRICARARSCPRSNRAIAIAGRWRRMCRCRAVAWTLPTRLTRRRAHRRCSAVLRILSNSCRIQWAAPSRTDARTHRGSCLLCERLSGPTQESALGPPAMPLVSWSHPGPPSRRTRRSQRNSRAAGS
jgi:uncharacterized protein DUF6510